MPVSAMLVRLLAMVNLCLVFPMLSIIFVRRHSGSLDLRCSAPVPSVFVILCAQHHYLLYANLRQLPQNHCRIHSFARKQLRPGAESVIFGLSAILRAAVRQNTPGSFQRKTLDKHRDM